MLQAAHHGSATASLKVQGLACQRNDRFLFQDLEFELAPGELLLVEGANGCGKTTLLRILTGLRRQERGEIFWQGQPVRQLNGRFQHQLLYVGHSNAVKKELTVRENLQQLLALLGVPSGTAGALLQELGLLLHADQPVGRLSAGQQRRLALARLAISRAPLWILDEPFTSLDRHGIDWIEGLIEAQLKADGMAIVSSHQPLGLMGEHIKRIRLSS